MCQRSRSSHGARLCLALGAAASLMVLASSSNASASDDSDVSVSQPAAVDGVLDLAAVEKRFRKEQGYWTVQLVLTSSFAVVPMAARQIHWGVYRACGPTKARCGAGYATIPDIIWISFSMINLGLGVPCVLGAKLTLMTLKNELAGATSAGVLAREWRRRGDQVGLAAGLTAAIGVGGGFLMAGLGGRADSRIGEVGLVMAIGSGVASLVLLHIALPHAVMADEVERTSGLGKYAARRGPRLTAISPLGVSGVW